jgi:A/G-specific adenine glycosylase
MPNSALHQPVLDWFATHARDLPWRHRDAGPWAVMVSEVMLQQTPVARVLPAYEAWMQRWPTPGALADEAPGEAVRMWGRLGYPRRALRLHEAAITIEETYNGIVPSDFEELRTLPGIGDYTAAAVAAFAYRQRHVVLDTNVRRVLSRVVQGVEFPAKHLTAAERQSATEVLPDDPETAARWSVGVMELGALVCSATSPPCATCPLATRCRWRAGGYPAYDGPARRTQTYAGTDRQCRGRILQRLRDSDRPVSQESIESVWEDPIQRDRALASLLDDGLVVPAGSGAFALP